MSRRTLLRRAPAENSQIFRRSVQLVFLALNLWIGVEFLLWLRYFESGGRSMRLARPS